VTSALGAVSASRGPLEVLTWPALAEAGCEVVATTRAGGVSAGPYATLNLGLHVGDDPDAVRENRRRAAGALAATPADLVVAAQVHGDGVARVTAADRGRGAGRADDAVPDADALVTTSHEVVLVTLVADCVPLALFDPAGRRLATVHAGWRGTVARVVERALGAMTAAGTRPGDVLAVLGPSIAAARYQVGDEVVEAARRGLGPLADEVLAPDGTGRHRLDLAEANRRLLLGAGVPAGQIGTVPFGTGPPGPCFSDRAERPCGRFALLARLQPGGAPPPP
jgi:polyphenol oxidase